METPEAAGVRTFVQTRLTAVFRGKLPQVEVLHGEVDEGGQFAGSSCLGETFQVWTAGRVKDKLLLSVRSALCTTTQGNICSLKIYLIHQSDGKTRCVTL